MSGSTEIRSFLPYRWLWEGVVVIGDTAKSLQELMDESREEPQVIPPGLREILMFPHDSSRDPRWASGRVASATTSKWLPQGMAVSSSEDIGKGLSFFEAEGDCECTLVLLGE